MCWRISICSAAKVKLQSVFIAGLGAVVSVKDICHFPSVVLTEVKLFIQLNLFLPLKPSALATILRATTVSVRGLSFTG